MTAIAPTAAYADTFSCSGDECDAFAWAAARGPANDGSYWGMSPGHNCTNYVAWKLGLDGIVEPATNPGDAADWATGARADGFLVDSFPAVGAVAQWEGLESGYGVDGHVAYVERVNLDGSIVVSEDYWRDGSQTGPLTFRTLDASTVSNFIHYGDVPDRLRQASLGSLGWQESGTGLRIVPTAFSTVNLAGSVERFVYAQDGKFFDAMATPTGWDVKTTSISSQSRALSAVDMGSGWPHVMSIDSGRLYDYVGTRSGWQRMSTGLEISGDIAALNLGGLAPTVMISQDGTLWSARRDMSGWWVVESTGLEAWGPIAALNLATSGPVVFSVESGTVQRMWRDEEGWHKESTGIFASGPITAVEVDGAAQLFVAENETLHRIFEDVTGWSKESLAIRAGTTIAAFGAPTGSPKLLQLGFAGRASDVTDLLRVVPSEEPTEQPQTTGTN